MQGICIYTVPRIFLFILLPSSASASPSLRLLLLFLRAFFSRSFMLFCVSRARIKIVFVCGSGSLKCEMGNGKWKMLQGGV